MHRAPLPLVLALLVVLAGCAAPVADSGSVDGPGVGDERTAVETASTDGEEPDDERAASAEGPADAPGETDEPDGLEVRNGELPVDENRTFERVQDLLDVEMRSPVVYVEEPLQAYGGIDRDPSSFYVVMNVTPSDLDDAGLGAAGVASPANTVYVLPDDDATPAEVERVLAHELVHAAQFQNGVPREFLASVPQAHRGTTDADLARTSVMEAGAVYGSTAYTEAYDLDVEPEGEYLERRYPAAPPVVKLVWGPYYYGYRYVDDAYDSPADHWELYDEPPVTMRAVMTGERGTGGDLEPFEASLAAGDSGWRLAETDAMGAFVLERVLETELEADESHEVATGWTYDRLARVDHEDVALDGHAWSVRFESADDAEAFETAAVAYLESRAESAAVDGEPVDGDVPPARVANATWYADGYAYALSGADDEDRTVAILAGPDAFVEAASVESAGRSDVRVVVESGPRGVTATNDTTADEPPTADEPTTNGTVAEGA